MQQLPPFPDNNPPEPSQPGQPTTPGQPTETPSETPPTGPDIDVPSPSQPGTDPSPTPISSEGRCTVDLPSPACATAPGRSSADGLVSTRVLV